MLSSLPPAGTAEPPGQTPRQPAVYPPIKGARVKLECVSPGRVFQAGQPAKLTFRLKNLSARSLVVYEWFMTEANNLVIHYAREDASGQEQPDQAEWLTFQPQPGPKERRSTLELMPGNATLIDCELPFVRQLDPKTLTKPATFLLYAELNLNSLSAKSPIIVISVQPEPVAER